MTFEVVWSGYDKYRSLADIPAEAGRRVHSDAVYLDCLLDQDQS